VRAGSSFLTGAETRTTTEALPAPPGPGEVVLDLGGDIGAAVIYALAGLDGEEIEFRAVGEPWAGTHTAVRERRLPGGSRWAAVVGPVRKGSYDARLKGANDPPTICFEVVGGVVACADWPGG
jgi:hypothetical protein